MDAFRHFLHKENGHAVGDGHSAHETAGDQADGPGSEGVPAKVYSLDAVKHAGLPEGADRSGGDSADSDTTTSSDNVSSHACRPVVLTRAS